MALSPVQLATQEAAGNVQIKTFLFPFQSFFDSTQLGQAIAVQPPNELIVPSTVQVVPTPGFGLGLHPDSACPVAVKFKSNAGVTDSQTITLTPGQIVFPHGCAPFSGFTCGLPFGWLGGGAVQLVVMKTPESLSWWASGSEVIIQRQRVVIQADGAAPTFSLGLPTGFPWVNALRYNPANPAAPFPQGAQAVVTTTPTRTELKLRLTTLAADARVLILVKNTTPFDVGAGSPPALSGEVEAVPVLFPAIVGAFAYFPTIGYSFPIAGNQLAAAGQGDHSPGVLLAGDNATFCILNESGNAALTGAFIDMVRYALI